MQIISNNCCAGYLYRLLGEGYQNPLVWGSLDFDQMERVYKRRNNLKFFPYKADIDTRTKTVHLESPDFIVNYTHYIEDKNYEKPTRISERFGNDIFCKNIIRQYLRKIYRSRAERYNPKDKFLFILDTVADGGRHIRKLPTKKDIKNFLSWETDKNVTLAIITKEDLKVKNKDIIVVQTDTGVVSKNVKLLFDKLELK